MDFLQVLINAAQTALTANSSISSLVSDRIWFNAAPPPQANAFPYILMSYGSGGLLNDNPHDGGEMELMISAVSQKGGEAQLIAGYIFDTLHRKNLIYMDSWLDWDTVKQITPFSRELTTQQSEYHQYGAYYRFRIKRGN